MTAPQLLLDGKPLVIETYDVHLPPPNPGTDYRALAVEHWGQALVYASRLVSAAEEGLLRYEQLDRAREWFKTHQPDDPLWRRAQHLRWRRQDQLGAVEVRMAWAEMEAWHACTATYVAVQYVSGRLSLEQGLWRVALVYPKRNPPAAIWELLGLGRPAPGVWPPVGTPGSETCEWSVECSAWGFRTARWTREEMVALVNRHSYAESGRL